MAKYALRRAQLIAPFGTGALQVVSDGTSVITAGLDHWYEREEGAGDVDAAEFRLDEWRLQERLGVDHFLQPPDSRSRRRGQDVPNTGLTVPLLRFPQWHFCPRCRRLWRLPLTARGRQRCQACLQAGKKVYLAQVPFVAMCEQGHLQDFPWHEWVHRSAKPECPGALYLYATGGASLSAQRVECKLCGKERNLGQITTAYANGTTYLSLSLDSSGTEYLCQGGRPWLGTEEGEPCDSHLRGSLRSASNLYFADVQSAIYLPRGNENVPAELVELLEAPPLRSLVDFLAKMGQLGMAGTLLLGQQPRILKGYEAGQIDRAARIVAGVEGNGGAVPAVEVEEDEETAFRRAEYRALRQARQEEQLTVEVAPLEQYGMDFQRFFDTVGLVTRLRETRALAGFGRVFPPGGQNETGRQRQLRRELPVAGENWLPAYRVYGEGIFLSLREELVRDWEAEAAVVARVRPLLQRFHAVQEARRLRERPLGPRFLLLHTLSHLLINRLTFECGYSTAALRERLYVSADAREPMAGILIYTAAGDAEGTMGGLVRMGRPGNLEPVFERALAEARWCSADPVCSEIGSRSGQGPDSCNLAACHNCALIPETACEEFNRFLDRTVVVGEPMGAIRGFFEFG